MSTAEQLDAAPEAAATANAASVGLAGRAIRGGAVLMAARLAVQGLLWGVTLTIARLLTPSDYGLMTTGMIFFGLADLLAEAGVGRALIQKKDLEQADLDATFTLSLTLAALLYAVLYLIAGPVAMFLELPEFAPFLRVLGLLVLTMPFRTVSLALLDRELHMGRQAAVHVLMTCTQSATVLALAFAGYSYWSLAIGALLARGLEAVLLVRAANWRPRLGGPRQILHTERLALLRFGVHVSMGSLLWFIYSKSDFAIIALAADQGAVGLYALAFQLVSMPVEKLTVNTNQVAYPVFCRIADDPCRLRAWYLRLTVVLGVFGMPVLAGMALVANDAFPLLLGDRWTRAVLPFQLLSVVGIVMLYGTSLPPLLNALGRPDINLRYTMVCTLVMPAGFVLGGWLAGLEGICIARVLLYPLVLAGLVVLTRPVTGVGLIELLVAQRAVLTATAFMIVVVWLVRTGMAESPPAWRLTAAVVAGVVSYAGYLLMFARQTVLADLRQIMGQMRGGVVEENA